jgi:hypothetical protein
VVVFESSGPRNADDATKPGKVWRACTKEFGVPAVRICTSQAASTRTNRPTIRSQTLKWDQLSVGAKLMQAISYPGCSATWSGPDGHARVEDHSAYRDRSGGWHQ